LNHVASFKTIRVSIRRFGVAVGPFRIRLPIHLRDSSEASAELQKDVGFAGFHSSRAEGP
jgi:hypothetical protein